MALLENAPCVRLEHVTKMAKPVLRHRIRLGQIGGTSEDEVIARLIENLFARGPS